MYTEKKHKNKMATEKFHLTMLNYWAIKVITIGLSILKDGLTLNGLFPLIGV